MAGLTREDVAPGSRGPRPDGHHDGIHRSTRRAPGDASHGPARRHRRWSAVPAAALPGLLLAALLLAGADGQPSGAGVHGPVVDIVVTSGDAPGR